METLDYIYNGGAIFVVGMALFVMYRILDWKTNGKNGNGKNGNGGATNKDLLVKFDELGKKFDNVGSKIDHLGDRLESIAMRYCDKMDNKLEELTNQENAHHAYFVGEFKTIEERMRRRGD